MSTPNILPAQPSDISDIKVERFEFIIFNIIEWYQENREKNALHRLSIPEFNTSSDNDFSKLKLIKLHFFISAIGAPLGLLNMFDSFHAMQLGHVELDIYQKMDKVRRFVINDTRLTVKNDYSDWEDVKASFSAFSKDDKISITNAVQRLKAVNVDFIKYSAFQLVEISHTWRSWRAMYKLAQAQNRRIQLIPSQLILEEEKSFFF